MDLLKKASTLAEEAAKRSQELIETAKRSTEFISVEASKRADRMMTARSETTTESTGELERFGLTEELREFVSQITLSTFRDFPLPDDSEMSNVPTTSNISQDLTDWQAKHAGLVLSTVKVSYENKCMEEAKQKLLGMENHDNDNIEERPKTRMNTQMIEKGAWMTIWTNCWMIRTTQSIVQMMRTRSQNEKNGRLTVAVTVVLLVK